jgi:predicted aminopeptidase
MVREQWEGTNYYGGWMAREPNNADLTLIGTYLAGVCAFEKLFAESNRNFEAFHELVEIQSQQDDAARLAWLQAPC